MGKNTPDTKINEDAESIGTTVASESDKQEIVDFISTLEDEEKITVLEARAAGVSPAAIAWGIENKIFQEVTDATDLEMHDLDTVVDNTDMTVGDIQKRALAEFQKAQRLKEDN